MGGGVVVGAWNLVDGEVWAGGDGQVVKVWGLG